MFFSAGAPRLEGSEHSDVAHVYLRICRAGSAHMYDMYGMYDNMYADIPLCINACKSQAIPLVMAACGTNGNAPVIHCYGLQGSTRNAVVPWLPAK